MEIIRYTSPYDYEKVLALIEQTFGAWEAQLELPQMNGDEAEQNTDWIYVAIEDGQILGTVHATIPKKMPKYCGVSGVCTVPAARGKGVSKKLFARMMEDVDAAGVQISVLGTGNPIASKLYSSFGFEYLFSSGVMIRLQNMDIVDYTRNLFSGDPGTIRVVDGSADFRIPMITLSLLSPLGLLDCNTNLYSRGFFSQTCCMSLYQRYRNLSANGGRYYGAIGERGDLGAMASVAETDAGNRADFFYVNGYEKAVPELLEKCCAGESVYLQLLDTAKEKIALAQSLGYAPVEPVVQENSGWSAPAKIYRKV